MTSPGTVAWAAIDDLPAAVADLHDLDGWTTYLGMATDILWAATGRRWRGASQPETVVLRAAPPPTDGGWAWHRSWGICGCYGGTQAGAPYWLPVAAHVEPRTVRLPRPDVTAVSTVTVNDTPFTAWELDGSWLSRTDGQGWPVCRDRATVTYSYGREAPAGGRAACAELAAELGRASSTNPDRATRLPQRLTSVTRQGISFAAIDPLDFLDKGLVGIATVDLWIRSVSPKQRARAAIAWSPDLAYARRTP